MTRCDLVVIGGGIQGAGVARDAALRGLSVVLFERGDLGGATSSSTSKLVHGGIRYLETFQLKLVYEALRERALLLELAPHLVWPLPFLLPYYEGEGRPRWYLELGLHLYDQLAGAKRIEKMRSVSREEALALEPDLPAERLKGAGLYLDAQMDDARLCLENALEAEELGAAIHPHHEVTGLRREGDRWRVEARDRIEPESDPFTVEAPAVLNATGPWVDRVRAMAGVTGAPTVRASRGAHLVVRALTRSHAILLTANRDDRVFFVLPQNSASLVGTTEAEQDGPEHEGPTLDDVRYLLGEVQDRWPAHIDHDADVQRAFAGVRPLVREESSVGQTTREERIVNEDRLFTVLGGKYTTYRAVSERMLDRILEELGRTARPCTTQERPFASGALGSREQASAQAPQLAADWSLSEVDARRLVNRYGARVEMVLQRTETRRGVLAEDGLRILEAEVVDAVERERARRLDDVLWRRLGLWPSLDGSERAAATVAGWMRACAGWSESREREETDRFLRALQSERSLIQRSRSG